MKHSKIYLSLALTVVLLLSTLCGIGLVATADETAYPDVLYLDPADCADLIPTYTKGENNAFEVEGNMRWYFNADILKHYRYITVTISDMTAGGYVPMWGDVQFAGNTAAGNLSNNRVFNGTATMDLALEDLSAAAYRGFQLISEVPAGSKVTMTVSLHKTDPNNTIYLDPAKCGDLVPTYTKGENNSFEAEGAMRWYFDPAVIKPYKYITVTIDGLESGCFVPMWGDVQFEGNTAAGNLTSNRLFNGTATIDLSLENLSGATYNGFQLIPEGIAAGDKATITISMSKTDPKEKIFLDPANCADLVPTYTKGENNAFTASGAMRWYFPNAMEEYRYIIISVNPWGEGNIIPQWGDKNFEGNSASGCDLVSLRMIGGLVTEDNTVFVLDRSLETFEPAYNGLQLILEGITADSISYNYICLSKNAFPPQFNATTEPEASDVSEDLMMQDGAAVRTTVDETSGLRFTTLVPEEKIAALDADVAAGTITAYEFGTLMLPERLLDGALTVDTANVLKVQQTKWHESVQEGYKRMTAVLWGIPASAYGDAIAARAYLTVTYADGSTETLYSAFDAQNNVRCIQEVAAAAYEHRNEITPAYTVDELTVLRQYAGITE